MCKRNLASCRQAYDMRDSKLLTQKLEKDYFIKVRRLGNIRKWRIDTPRDKRAQTVPHTGVNT
jgi:hypothetical protein